MSPIRMYQNKMTGQIVAWSEIHSLDLPFHFSFFVFQYEKEPSHTARILSEKDFLQAHELAESKDVPATKMGFSCMKCPFYSSTVYCLKMFKPDIDKGCEFGRRVFEMDKLIKEGVFAGLMGDLSA